MNQQKASEPSTENNVFNAETSKKILDHVSRQIVAIANLQESETKPEVLQSLSFDLMWLQFWEFTIISGAEFGWSFQQCYEFKAYDIYKFKDELENRRASDRLVLPKSEFPTWLLKRETLNMPLHEQTYPFYEVKVMSMVTQSGLYALFKRMLNAGNLPSVSLLALQNECAVPFLSEQAS